MIYFTSDFHFNHWQPFLYEPRGFSNIEEHDATIIKNWNDIITDEDTVYVLGDLYMGTNQESAKHKINSLNGNLKVILGNHDSPKKIELYKSLYPKVEVLGYANILKYHHYNFYLSHYPTIISNYDMDKSLRQRTICLCGHSHTSDKFADFDKGLIYHVELNAHNNKPVSIDAILKDIKNKINETKPL